MQAVMSSHFPEVIGAEPKPSPKAKKSPLQKLPTLSELFSIKKNERKHEMAGGEIVPDESPHHFSTKPSPFKRQNTHGGEHSPGWRTQEAMVPSERLLTSSDDDVEYYNSLETEVDLTVGLDHARYLVSAHRRLKHLNLADFILPSHIVIAPKIFGDIESEVIGEGSQATVFRAHVRGRGNELFAVKCGDSKTILQEFSICRMFNHENILKAHGFSIALDLGKAAAEQDSSDTEDTRSSPGSPRREPRWIYMAVYEYCGTGDLASYISRHPEKKSDIRFLQNVFTGVSRGLVHIHARDFVHCDIKPENILISANGIAKIADFGMCQPASSRMIPQGTPSFIAPEVLVAWFSPKDQHRFSNRIDIFSLGAMAVKLVTSRYPFSRTTARMSRKERFTLQELRTHFELSEQKYADISRVSQKFADLVVLCLQHEAIDRPSAEHLLELISC